jgi:hypothetical protein
MGAGAREYYDYRRAIYGDITHKAILVDAAGTLLAPTEPMAQVRRAFDSQFARPAPAASPIRSVPLPPRAIRWLAARPVFWPRVSSCGGHACRFLLCAAPEAA